MKTIFCKFIDGSDRKGNIKLTPIGRAENTINRPMLPGWKDIKTRIVLDKKYSRGLDGIEDYSHIIAVYWMNKEAECHLVHHPQGNAEVPWVGIFACRCPQRPNRIALSTVKLLFRRGNVLTVEGLDIVNGTPIIDIKPYTPRYDEAAHAKVPSWVNKLIF